jgi:hypothetical protein
MAIVKDMDDPCAAYARVPQNYVAVLGQEYALIGLQRMSMK